MIARSKPPPNKIVANSPDDRKGTLKRVGGSQSDNWNNTLANQTFHPYSDFLLHDMGTLGDGIGNDGDSVARTRQMRTAPLWGLRSRNNVLHDGRTTDRSAAIRAHAGQGAAAATAFSNATSAQRNDLLLFLSSL